VGRRRGLVVLLSLIGIVALGIVVSFGTYRLAVSRAAPPPPTAAVPQASVAPPQPVLGPVASQAPAPTGDGVDEALAGALADPRLGSRVAASVVDAGTGKSLFAQRADEPVVPASTTKLITAAAVLSAVGPDRTITTKVVAGSRPGVVVLVGGGDPTLSVDGAGTYPEAASISQLAVGVRAALGDTAPTAVVVDTSLYGGGTLGPGWDVDLVSTGNVAPIVAVAVNGGRTRSDRNDRVADPDLAAGRALATALGLGVDTVSRGTAPAGAKELAALASPPVRRLVETMLANSDNVLAEALARQVALARDQPATFAGAATAVIAELKQLGADVDVVDGSGLSRRNQLTAGALTTVLSTAASDQHEGLRPLLTGLSVAGWSGTLNDRFTGGASTKAVGAVRGKTGTLSGVDALAGTVVDADGRQLAFAFIANGVPDGGGPAAEVALDAAAAAVSACGCR
jgi:D-alanyl-D-alanine carboxypeptidase/D-alanyl-D-alanine-endopeptidase (penicillin-binding protein 4)